MLAEDVAHAQACMGRILLACVRGKSYPDRSSHQLARHNHLAEVADFRRHFTLHIYAHPGIVVDSVAVLHARAASYAVWTRVVFNSGDVMLHGDCTTSVQTKG
jgi:hypothetical protein